MSRPARHSAHSMFTTAGSDPAQWVVLPDERVGPPLAGKTARQLRRGFALLIVLGSGWALLDNLANVQTWLQANIAPLSASMDRNAGGAAPPTTERIGPTTGAAPSQDNVQPALPSANIAGPTAPPLIPKPLVASEVPAVAPSTADAMPAPLTTAAPPSVGTSYDAGPTSARRAADADPNQKRAEIVGLHPDLSPALLKRLSPADFRNAGIAVKKAVTETPDDAVFVWPLQRAGAEALFKVHFVAGAAENCRRYVVTVSKDGWLTTALPMEKCGMPRPRARAE